MTSQPDEALVQQLAERLTDLTYQGRQLTSGHAAQLVCAALASGLVVPAEPVRQVANRYDGRRTNGSAVANRLRAILGDPQHVKDTQ